MADIGFIPPQKTRITFAVEPVYNMVNSMLLLGQDVSGCGEWVDNTVAQFTSQELARINMLVGAASMSLCCPVQPDSFDQWLVDLANQDPYKLVQDEVEHLVVYAQRVYEDDPSLVPTTQQLYEDRDVYLGLMQRLYEWKGDEFDRELYEYAYDLLQDPPERLARIVACVTQLWEDHLAAEWETHLPELEDSVRAFQSLDLDHLTTAEAVRRIIGRDEPEQWGNWRENLHEIIFIPSAHIGPYLLMIDKNEVAARVVFGARIPEGATVQSPALSRSDLLVRLVALADDTRLRILHLIAHDGEQDTKSIMEQLDLSKSAASRHLRQLTASGYTTVRQQDVSKFYNLNPDRIDDTWRALKALLDLG